MPWKVLVLTKVMRNAKKPDVDPASVRRACVVREVEHEIAGYTGRV